MNTRLYNSYYGFVQPAYDCGWIRDDGVRFGSFICEDSRLFVNLPLSEVEVFVL